jgi:hypothetical protein
MSDFIFQSVPERYDLSNLKRPPERLQRWQATRYRRVMRPGDAVYFYMSGAKAGIYGYGYIDSLDESDVDPSVSVRWTALYPSRISRTDLELILGQNLLFTVRVGTNFLLSREESSSLRMLISSRGLPAPEGGE